MHIVLGEVKEYWEYDHNDFVIGPRSIVRAASRPDRPWEGRALAISGAGLAEP